jgi:membrane associated rhomboid family serine protease
VPTCYRHPGRETYIRCQRCDRPICPDCMRDAAVGFQCPSCVAEGAKGTRAGRTAYGGLRSANPQLTSIVIIAINVAVWLLIAASGGGRSSWVNRLALHAEGICSSQDGQGYFPSVDTAARCNSIPGTAWFDGVADGAGWQLVTSMFTHVEVIHIAFNMLALWILGPQLELAIGRVRFLALYLLSGLAGSVCVYWLSDPQTATLGASGAVFGLMAGLLVVAFKVRGNVQSILMWIGLNAVITVFGRGFISWQGHLGGFVGGLLLALVIVYAPRNRRVFWQVSGLCAIGAVLAALVLVRTLQLA